MRRMNVRKALAVAALIGTSLISATALADPQHGDHGPGHGMGPGMMSGYGPSGDYGPGGAYGPGYGMGPGMMGGYGPGYGMGPGMMGGYGPGYSMGPGMMGAYGPGYGMGPGMMGGYGPGHHMGPGMMGGYGMGPGMMSGYGPGYGMGPGMMGGMMGPGYGVLGQLNLTPEQWDKVNAIYQQSAKKQWELTGKVREEAFKLRELLSSEKRDRSAIDQQYQIEFFWVGLAFNAAGIAFIGSRLWKATKDHLQCEPT